jgi:hypothetical protein
VSGIICKYNATKKTNQQGQCCIQWRSHVCAQFRFLPLVLSPPAPSAASTFGTAHGLSPDDFSHPAMYFPQKYRYMEEYMRMYMMEPLSMDMLQSTCWRPRHLPHLECRPTPNRTSSTVLRERGESSWAPSRHLKFALTRPLELGGRPYVGGLGSGSRMQRVDRVL